MMAASCIGVVLLVVLLEFLRRMGREYDQLLIDQVRRHGAYLVDQQARYVKAPVSECTRMTNNQASSMSFRVSPLQQLARAVIHAVTFGVGYIVMLLAMYFNGYIIISIVIGSAIGKFFADWLTVTIRPDQLNSENEKNLNENPTCCE